MNEGTKFRENFVYSDDNMVILSSKSKANFMSFNFDHDFEIESEKNDGS